MSAPVTPLRWSSKKSANSTTTTEYHLKSPPQRTPGGTSSGNVSNTGGHSPARSSSATRMTAVFCDVVVEGAERSGHGWDLPPEILSFLPTLGRTLEKPTSSPAFPTTPSRAGLDELASHADRPPDIERRRNLLLELIKTEETYVKRLNVLYKLYAHPLRDFTRNRDTEIINAFEAKQIFGNIEAILPANEALLVDLRESLYGNHEGKTFEHWASVMLRHLDHFRSVYPAYILNLERAKDLERELRRRNAMFRNFIEKTRESAGAGNDNCSLESLLIEPAQRIPRYRLLLKGIVREVEEEDKYRHVMLEAIELASSIAALDEDEDTRRAAALFGLGRSIDGLPPRITNSNRYFVDCIDVFDRPLPSTRAASAPGHGYSVHQEELLCTLFLFNDRLIVTKRDSADGTGRSIAGLDNINKLVREMQMPDPNLNRSSKSPRKNKAKAMRFRGDFDLGELVAKDEDEIGFSLFLERPPTEYTDRWNGRPLRQYQILKPEKPSDKARFLANIWNCVALIKAEKHHSETRIWSNTALSAYWNIYDKRSYLSEMRKAKIALQVVAAGETPLELPLGAHGPHAVATAYFMENGTCQYYMRIRGQAEEPAITNLPPSKLIGEILQTARKLRLYDAPPQVPGTQAVSIQREDSRMSTHSRALSASSSRPRSVIDFMRSPGGSIQSSPRRTLSKASRASTLDSRQAGSIFSGEYASTAQTSLQSQDSRSGSPYKRALSPPTRPPGSGITGVPTHSRHNSDGSSLSISKRPARYMRETSPAAPSDSLLRKSSCISAPHASRDRSEDNLNDAYDQDALSRSRSDGSLYKSSSSQSLTRYRSETLSRATSTQSMRIDEDEAEQEVLQAAETPERALSPPLQRSGTINRPMGPRQLGSRSPGLSPQPLSPSGPRNLRGRSPTPSPLDDDPFVLSSSAKKRIYDDSENDDASISSKRPSKERPESMPEDYSRESLKEAADRDAPSTARPSERRDHVMRSVAAAEVSGSRDLHRTGSLPRSPNTRSLYQKSRGLGDAASKPSPLVKSTRAGQRRGPVKPVGNERGIDDLENTQPDSGGAGSLTRQNTTNNDKMRDLHSELARLKEALRLSEDRANGLEKSLKTIEEQHNADLDAFSNEAIQMANARIEREAALRDARVSALEAEIKKLKHENRALQALLRKREAA